MDAGGNRPLSRISKHDQELQNNLNMDIGIDFWTD